VRYKARSPLAAHSRSRSPVRARPASREHVRTRSASRSPKTIIASRPRGRLLGKTPPLPPPSPPRYGANMKAEAPVTKGQRERSRSPLAYSSRKIARAYTPPSPQAKAVNSYEKKFSASPVRKRNSPPPKAYALSPDRRQSPGWSRSRSKSVDGKYASRSAMHRVDNRSSSSTSPPRYGRSPAARENCPSVAAKREPVTSNTGQTRVMSTQRSPSMPKHDHSPVQRYRLSCTSAKHSRSPDVAKRDRSPIYQRVNSPARTSRRHASPETTRSKLESYQTTRLSAVTETTAQWSQAVKRSEQNLKRSPVSLARNGRSPADQRLTVTTSDRVRSSGRMDSSPVSRDRRSPRRRR